MIFDVLKRQVLLCILLGLSGISALARVDNWSQRRPNNTLAGQNQQGYRPAVGFQQPPPQTQWNRYNQTQPQPQWQQHNNRTQNNYQPTAPQANQNPWIRNNQTQYYPPPPTYGQGSYNKTQGWAQPNNSHLYPTLPNNHQNIPALPSSSWSPPANQTLVYPQIPNRPVQPNVAGNGSPLAPLQPQNSQGPQNWQSSPGGQSALSYGPGHYSQPAGNPYNTPPVRQGSSNPYANMFH